MEMRQARFVLLDRDGTINIDRDYLSDPAQLELIAGAAEGLRLLKRLGCGLIVVTNQSGVGRGKFGVAEVEAVHARLRQILADEGVKLDGIYYCPHVAEDGCGCRKPARGLIDQAARDLRFDPSTSFVIGDKASDIELGRTVGAKTLLVRTGYGNHTAQDQKVEPDYIVADLLQAARTIEFMISRCNANDDD
jgi:D-glycero-D-manno-heptose 1,7-bisphosphate phosphatase